MAFKKRRGRPAEPANDAASFSHASGKVDLEGVLGEHTLSAEQAAATVAPKGYRSRSIAKEEPPRRR